MARLPTVGGDAGNWGEVLNDYLVQSHAADGLLKTDSVGAPQLKPSSVTSAALAPGAVTSAKIDKLGQAGGVATLDGSGKLPTTQLPSLSKADVGLSNVDNTSDVAKPVSTAQQTALDAKLNAAEKGAASGVATLDASLKLLETNIPTRLGSTNLNTTYALKSELVVTKVATSGDTTGATDRAAIQAAIDNATAAGGGEVRLIGDYWINGVITLKSGVHLVGEGWQRSVINLATGSNSRMIELPSASPSPIYFGIRDIKLDGWRENQTAGDTAIYMNMGTAPLGIAGCSVPFFERLMVQYAYGDGFQIGTAVEGRFNNLYAYRNGGYGIRALSGTDRWFTDCTAGQNVLAGFKASASNGDRFIGCKSWESGKNAARGASNTAVVNPATPNWDMAGANMRLIECEAQDAAAEGFWINTNNSKFIIHGDSNSGSHLQLRQATGNDVDLLVGTGTGHGVTTPAAVYIFDVDSVNNRIHTTFDSYAYMTTSGIVGGVITDKNEIIVGTPNSLYTTVYAATITPDPLRGYIGVTLTGNVTIANTLVDRKIPNMEFDVWLTQDAVGGRTVTWGADYLGVSAATTTANTVNRWRFRSYNRKWYQVSYAAY